MREKERERVIEKERVRVWGIEKKGNNVLSVSTVWYFNGICKALFV